MMNKRKVDDIDILRLVFSFDAPRLSATNQKPGLNERLITTFGTWVFDATKDLHPARILIEVDLRGPVGARSTDAEKILKSAKEAVAGSSDLTLKVVTDGARTDRTLIEFLSRSTADVAIDLTGLVHRSPEGYVVSDEVAAGIKLLQRAAQHDLIAAPSVRWTLDGIASADALYHYFTTGLGFLDLDFRLPHHPGKEIRPEKTAGIATQFSDIFSSWSLTTQRNINIEIFDEFFHMLGHAMVHKNFGIARQRTTAITIYPDGSFERGDGLGVAESVENLSNIDSTSLIAYLERPLHQYIACMEQNISPECNDCAWVGICRSGNRFRGLVHRFDGLSSFTGRSVFCDALKNVFLNLIKYLIQRNVKQEDIICALEELRNQSGNHSVHHNKTQP